MTLCDLAYDALRGDEAEGFAVMPSLAEALTARVIALDEAVLELELDALRSFCDLMLGRGATEVAEVVIEAVAGALVRRKAASAAGGARGARVEEKKREAVVGAASVRAPVVGDRRGGGALLALRAAVGR